SQLSSSEDGDVCVDSRFVLSDGGGLERKRRKDLSLSTVHSDEAGSVMGGPFGLEIGLGGKEDELLPSDGLAEFGTPIGIPDGLHSDLVGL
ncbi:hypothetical protein Dimus_035405, partial [Dionaea muscipula]